MAVNPSQLGEKVGAVLKLPADGKDLLVVWSWAFQVEFLAELQGWKGRWRARLGSMKQIGGFPSTEGTDTPQIIHIFIGCSITNHPLESGYSYGYGNHQLAKLCWEWRPDNQRWMACYRRHDHDRWWVMLVNSDQNHRVNCDGKLNSRHQKKAICSVSGFGNGIMVLSENRAPVSS